MATISPPTGWERSISAAKNTIKDAETAVSYLRQAANNGNANAQYLLGKLHLTGKVFNKTPMLPTSGSRKAYYGGHTYAGMFMDRIDRGEQHPPSVVLSATRLLYHMGNIFRDNAPASAVNGVQLDRKRLARLRQKARRPRPQAGRSRVGTATGIFDEIPYVKWAEVFSFAPQ